MGMFGNMKKDGLEEAQDRLGGFQVHDSGLYEATIKALYGVKTSGGSTMVTGVFEIEGKEYKESFIVANKKDENFYVKDGKKIPLTGYTLVDHLLMMTTDVPLEDQEAQGMIEEKTVKVYDPEAKKDIPKAVPMFTSAIGQKVWLGILRKKQWKQEKINGVYVDTDQTREVNETDKVFNDPQKLTVVEAMKGDTEGSFWVKWEERNKGNTRDQTLKGKPASTGGAGGGRSNTRAPQSSNDSGETPTRRTLFNKNK